MLPHDSSVRVYATVRNPCCPIVCHTRLQRIVKSESDVEEASTPAEVVAARTDNDADTVHVDDREMTAP